jgi:hypothetical protein
LEDAGDGRVERAAVRRAGDAEAAASGPHAAEELADEPMEAELAEAPVPATPGVPSASLTPVTDPTDHQGRVNARIRKSGARSWTRAGASFDLVVDEDTGESWNFLRAEDRRRCWRRLKQEDPWIVVGSPPCTASSRLQGLNKERGDPAKRQRKEVEGKVLLNFALDVNRWVLRARASGDSHFMEPA